MRRLCDFDYKLANGLPGARANGRALLRSRLGGLGSVSAAGNCQQRRIFVIAVALWESQWRDIFPLNLQSRDGMSPSAVLPTGLSRSILDGSLMLCLVNPVRQLRSYRLLR